MHAKHSKDASGFLLWLTATVTGMVLLFCASGAWSALGALLLTLTPIAWIWGTLLAHQKRKGRP